MHTLENMKEAIAYIENHLDQKLEYCDIAQVAMCSQYHFQRMFLFLTSVPLSEYIRRRRLTLAAFELQNSQVKVLDVALKYGYQSPDAFARAFQQLHGITPSAARKKGVRLKAYPPISFTLSLKGVTEMNYKIVEKPPLTVAGVKKRLSQMTLGAEVGAMWSSIPQETIAAIASMPPVERPGLLGVYNGMYEDHTTDYYIAAFTSPIIAGGAAEIDPSTGLEMLGIPAATWAVFEIKGALPGAMAQVWGRIFTEWFPTSGYEHAELPEIEWYSAGDMTSEDYESEIWIPVIARSLTSG